MNATLQALIVEDEPVSSDFLRSLLDESDGVEVVGTAANVSEAVAAIERMRPDVVFLDIQMPGGSGFDLIETLGPARMPAVVFVTAYDEYAVRAFEVMALDYLMKPFDEERLQRCLNRVQARLRHGPAAEGAEILNLLRDLRSQVSDRYVDRLAVDAGPNVKILPTEEIDWIEAKGKHVLVHTRSITYSMREGLSAIAGRLSPRDFLRVHRSAVVHVDRVKEVQRWSRGEYRLVLDDGTKLVTGQTYRSGVEARLLGR
jgi:two-component system, LytTR family, response regulator